MQDTVELMGARHETPALSDRPRARYVGAAGGLIARCHPGIVEWMPQVAGGRDTKGTWAPLVTLRSGHSLSDMSVAGVNGDA